MYFSLVVMYSSQKLDFQCELSFCVRVNISFSKLSRFSIIFLYLSLNHFVMSFEMSFISLLSEIQIFDLKVLFQTTFSRLINNVAMISFSFSNKSHEIVIFTSISSFNMYASYFLLLIIFMISLKYSSYSG